MACPARSKPLVSAGTTNISEAFPIKSVKAQHILRQSCFTLIDSITPMVGNPDMTFCCSVLFTKANNAFCNWRLQFDIRCCHRRVSERASYLWNSQLFVYKEPKSNNRPVASKTQRDPYVDRSVCWMLDCLKGPGGCHWESTGTLESRLS